MMRRVRLPAELVPGLPQPVRKVLRGAYRATGLATARLRPLPDFLILGAQKAGTTALYAYLRWHPDITGPSFKEVSFFDRHYAQGERWYRAHLPLRRRALVGEASPSYLFHPLAPERVRTHAAGGAPDRVAAQSGRASLLALPARGRARP